jgi:hypothetical protein
MTKESRSRIMLRWGIAGGSALGSAAVIRIRGFSNGHRFRVLHSTGSSVESPAARDFWSAAGSPETAAVATHGQLTSCGLFGSTWVVTTLHSSGPAEIGTFDCKSDAACRDGWPSHDLKTFSWQFAPAGFMLEFQSKTGQLISYYDGDAIITFDVTTNAFQPPRCMPRDTCR